MLHILLFILKMIGIILLCILGILILAVLCLLFVPVRYRIEAVRKEGEGEPPVAVRVKVTWLLHFLNALIRYAEELNIRVRVILFTVYRFPKREDVAKKQKKRKKEKVRRAKESAGESGDAGEKLEKAPVEKKAAIEGRGEAPAEEGGVAEKGPKAPEKEKTAAERRREAPEGVKTAAESRSESMESGSSGAEEKTFDKAAGEADEKKASRKRSVRDRFYAFLRKIRILFEKVKGLFVNIEYTIRQFYDKIKSVWNAVEFRYEVLTSDRFREAWELCQKELGKVLRSIRPRKLEADIVVGMEDPAATGEVLAVCGMLYPLIGSHVNVTGDFERKRLEGRVFMKGRISGFVLLWAGFKLYRNQNLRKVYGLLKKGGSVNV